MCPSDRNLRRDLLPSARPDLRTAFDVLDADGDGKISRDDLRSFYSSADEDVIAMMMSVADADRDGYVAYEEFERVLVGGCCDAATVVSDNGAKSKAMTTAARMMTRRLRLMEEVFRVMDRDGDGRVSHEDLRSYMEWAGLHVSEDEIRAMIRLGGGDESVNGGVSFQGLIKILALDEGFNF